MSSLWKRSAPLIGAAGLLALVAGLSASDAEAADRLAVRTLTPVLDGIRIEPDTMNLGPGESGQLTATGVYEDGSTADLTTRVLWKVRDDRVASVSETGLVTAVGHGSTIIGAEESESGVEARLSAAVVVAAVSSVSIVPATASVSQGQTVRLRALAALSDGRTGIDVTDLVQWTSGKTQVATVSDVTGTKGLVSGLQKGLAGIRAKHLASGRQSPNDQGLVTVTESAPPAPTAAPTPASTPASTPAPTPDPRIEEIVLVPAELLLLPGGALGQLQAIASMSDGSQRDVSREVVWTSNREHVAAVNGSGAVSSGESGTARIDAQHPASGIEARGGAGVWVGEVDALALSPTGAQLLVGGALELAAFLVYDNGLTENITERAEWRSEKERVATVSNAPGTKGRVAGVAKGDAVIVASDPLTEKRSNSQDGRVFVVGTLPTATPIPGATPTPVEVLDIAEIRLEPRELLLTPGQSGGLRALARFADGTTRDVTAEMAFASDKSQVASMTAVGVATGFDSGRAKIDAYHLPSGKDVRDEALVWVGEVESIDLSPSGARFLVGDTIQLRALATFDNGLSEDITDAADWSSEKTRVATVSNAAGSKGFVTGLTRGDAMIVARDPESGKASKSSSGRVVVLEEGELDPGDVGEDASYVIGLREIVLDPQSLNLMPGETGFVAATGIYADGSTRDLTPHVVFESRRSRTASVDETGGVVGRRGGATEIRAIEPITRIRTSVPTRVHVAKAISIAIEPPVRIIAPGQTLQLRARADFDNGVTGLDVTDEVSWSSSRSSVALVSNEVPSRGLLTGVALGETEITVLLESSRAKSRRDEGRVSVTTEGLPQPTPTPDPTGPVVPTHETWAPETIVLQEDETAQIVTTLHFSDGSQETRMSGLVYRVDDIRVARVDPMGVVLANGPGSASIRIDDEIYGFSGRVSVIVRAVSSLAIAPDHIALRVGGSAALRALATFSDGSTAVDVADRVDWKSEDPTVVAVDDGGRITARAEGSTRIVVMDRATRVRSDPSTGVVDVLGNPLRVFVTPSRLALPIGGEKSYKAFGVFADGSTTQITDDVIWSIESGSPPVASIDASGLVKALALGSAMVHATDRVTGISSSQSDGSRELSVVGDLLGIRVSTSNDILAEPSEVVLSAGETQSLKGLALFEGQTDGFNLGSDLDWFSSNPRAVSVNQSGLVTCLTVGVATISAVDPATGVRSTDTLGDLPITCSGRVVALVTRPAFRDLDYLATRQIRAFRLLEDRSEIEVTRKVRWTSTNPSIVTVSETGSDGGVATAVGDGQATLVAYDADFDVSSLASGQPTVIRTRKTRVLLEIFPEDDGVGFVGRVGQIYGFQARVTYASGARQGVNLLLDWTSSNTAIVLMGNGSETFKVNQALPRSPGTVTITGTYPADAASPSDLTASVSFQVLP